MLKLIDTISYENGKCNNLDSHNERINRSRRELMGIDVEINIENYIQVPDDLKEDKVKCKVLYGKDIEGIRYQKYVQKSVQSLKMVACDQIRYEYKYADRSLLNDLLQYKKDADDILIIKRGYITDISYANIIFLKEGVWITPENPLLRGTRCESYLRSGKLKQTLIRPEDLEGFSEARIINAMISLGQSPVIQIKSIIW